MKKCFLCSSFFLMGGGHIAVEGEDYLIKKPICKKCHKNMEKEYERQQKEEPEIWGE
jgi:hypothetical protein